MEIECLPKDLIQNIEVDLSGLANIGDAIHVKDIVLPKGVVSKHEPTDMVANVVEPKKVVEEAPVIEAAPAEGAEAKADEKVEDKKDEKKEDKK